MFLQLVTVAVGLLMLPVSYGTDQNLYFGLMIESNHEDDGARMGVKDAVNQLQRSSGYNLMYLESQVPIDIICSLSKNLL